MNVSVDPAQRTQSRTIMIEVRRTCYQSKQNDTFSACVPQINNSMLSRWDVIHVFVFMSLHADVATFTVVGSKCTYTALILHVCFYFFTLYLATQWPSHCTVKTEANDTSLMDAA